ncbi:MULTISPECIES: DUF3630 family protein [Vibrio]|uniref:DUF3630 family protein n=1 Tax=Vibrio anguillarum TaxID=55601 RepID=A0ABD4QW01_VIBAN|nr:MULTISPECIES: DUF3630 family protein [Vibrio]MBT2919450.1 DUF3630 family protein [Vibrio anguillarum]NAX43546.1 DUF3630 family protein [Vibrio sp. V25_P4S6T154]NNN99427.1 DUF3630 family protein [Vibrio sp. B1-2]OXX41054.1 aminopeptidase [Vibrio sp. V17_P4S1T151]OXX61361.1 aminopeptidase [Vibrio sp. V15_P4S5T153]
MAEFGLAHNLQDEGRLVLSTPRFDVDTFPALGERLVKQLSATVIEKQWDADVHSWLIDFEGCLLFLKAEHYSESVWLEALVIKESQEELAFLAQLLARGF